MLFRSIKYIGTVLFVFLLNLSFSQPYLFYLHGKIVENEGAQAVERVNGYGAYLYYPILDSLKKGGNKVISEVRAPNTDVKKYALKVAHQIDSLLQQGIKAESITVIGASKGALIAMYVSSYLKNKRVNYVFMAACYDNTSESDLNCYGNVLSIYEKSDAAGSCESLKTHSKEIAHYKEIQLSTGLKHGFLYKPLKEWIDPVLQWAKANYN